MQAAGVDNCQAMLRTVAAELAAMATLEIPEEVEVDKAGTIQGVFTDVGKLSEEPTLAGASRKVYVSKLHKFFDCSNEVYIIAQVYVNRLLQKHPNLVIQADTVNEMLLASVVLALKWHEEVCDQYPDAHYALHGGVSAEKLQRLEARFLALLDWELHVTPSEFHTYCGMAAALKVELAAKENHGREEQDDGNVVPELKEDQASQDEEEEENQCESTKPLTATITATVFPASHEIRTHEIHTPHTCDDRDHEYTFKGHEHEEDDDCFPGRPLWGPQSYWTPSTFNVPQEDLPHVHADEEDARSIYSVTSDSEDCLPGKPLWCDQSYRMTSFCSTAPGTPQAAVKRKASIMANLTPSLSTRLTTNVCLANRFGACGASQWLHGAAPPLEHHCQKVKMKKRRKVRKRMATAYLVGLSGVHRATWCRHFQKCHLDHTNNSIVLPMHTHIQKKRLEPTRIAGFHLKVGALPTSLTTNLWKGWVAMARLDRQRRGWLLAV